MMSGPRAIWAGPAPKPGLALRGRDSDAARRWWPVLAHAGRVVLLRHAGRDAPARTDGQAGLLAQAPDITGALAASRGPPGPTRWCPPRCGPPSGVFRPLACGAGMLDDDVSVEGAAGASARGRSGQ
jgi:hypothetical protein